MGVIADRLIIGYEPQAVLDRRREDQAVGGITGKGRGKGYGGVGDRGT